MEEGLALAAGLVAALFVCVGLVWWSPRWGAAATGLLGLWASGYLFVHKLDATGGPSMCNINTVVNCDVVNSSAASELFGIPVALLGAGFFLGIVAAAALAGSPRSRMFQVVAWLAGAGGLFSVYLAVASFRLGAVCVLCMTIYACCALVAWAGWRGARQEGTRLTAEPGEVVRSAPALVVAFAFLVVVAVGHSAWSSARARTSSGKVLEALSTGQLGADRATDQAGAAGMQITRLYARPSGVVAVEGDEPRRGDPNAPYTIVEYADFGCPHCAQAAAILEDLVATVPQVQVKFRVFPLSGVCNPLLEPIGDELEVGRCRAAVAARCAAGQGKFWEYATEVFAGQPDLSAERLGDVAKQVGLDVTALEACLADPATIEDVRRDALSGGELRLQGTPAFFLVGLTPEPIEVCGGIQAVLALLEAKAQGVELPPAEQSACQL